MCAVDGTQGFTHAGQARKRTTNRTLSPGLSGSCNYTIKLWVGFRHWFMHLFIVNMQCLLYIDIAFGFENIKLKNLISILKEINVYWQAWADKSIQDMINTLMRTWTNGFGGIEELTHNIFSKDWECRAEEMAHQLRALAPLPKDPSLVPRTHSNSMKPPVTPVPYPTLSSGLCELLRACCTHTLLQAHTCVQKHKTSTS